MKIHPMLFRKQTVSVLSSSILLMIVLFTACSYVFGQMKTGTSKEPKSVVDTSDAKRITTSESSDSLLEGCNFLLKQPIAIKRVDPVLPTFIHRELRATVFVKCLVGVDGKVKKAEIMKSDSEIFNQTVLDAALQWEFTPAESEEKVVEVWVVIPFHIVTGK